MTYFYDRYLELPASCRDCFFILTQKERQVFLLTVAGKSTREVAEELCVHGKTIESHKQNINRKLQFKNVVDWVKYAYQKGILTVNKEAGNDGR